MLRKNLLRATIRTTVSTLFKPLARPEAPLALQRVLLDNFGRAMRKPRGLQIENVSLAGLPARKLLPRNGAAWRHVLYLHGGAYIVGSMTSHTALAGQIASATRANAWLVEYRLAPEHPYPAAVEDAVAAYRDLLAQGIAATDILIAGDSAGGGLALATAIALRDAGVAQPAALVLISPWTDLTLSGRSLQTQADIEPMLNVPWIEWAAGLYCGEGGDDRITPRTAPGVSPLFADLAGLPPMLVHVGADEILLDDSTFLVERALQAKVDATLRVFDDLWHVFHAQAGLLPDADAALEEIGEFAKRIFAGR